MLPVRCSRAKSSTACRPRATRRRSRVAHGWLLSTLVALAASVSPGVSTAQDSGRNPRIDTPDAVEPAPAQGLSYITKLTAIENPRVQALLQEVLNALTAGRRAPSTLTGIERRTQSHVKELEKALRAEGYYDGKLGYRIDEQASPVEAVIDVDPGPQYIIKRYDIEYRGEGGADPNLPKSLAPLGMELGVAARSEFVLDVEQLLLDRLANSGHPLAKVADRRVVVDHADDTMSVTLQIEPGRVARFGPMMVTPLPTVREEYVRGFITWQQGEVFVHSRIDDFRSDLLDTGLFDAVAVELPGTLDPSGELPIKVTLTERKHRSVGFQGHWSTDEGLGVEAFWEHRNLFGSQERLSVTARIEQIRREFDLSFRKPRYQRKNQTLLVDGTGGYQDTDAYSGPLATGFAGLERRLNEAWSFTAGLRGELSNLDDFQGTRDFQVGGLSALGARDTSDDRLDPTRGTRLRLALTPYFANGDDGALGWIEATIAGSAYQALSRDGRAVLALRTKLGAITGEESASLPANRRFYAGGGASIRGYALQSVGPLAPDGTPLGGRSLVELSAEVRLKLSDTLGGVVFIDGGNVYDDTTPDFSQNLRWAVGVGARYFTAVGPFRFDFGFPLDPRPIDDTFQFYISVGQAF